MPPLGMILSVGSSIIFRWPPRSLARDTVTLLNSRKPRPLILGIENIPRNGAVLFVANHHHRKTLWIGWAGALLIEAVNNIRPARSPVRVVMNNAQRMSLFGQNRIMPFSRFAFRRVAHFWQMLLIPVERENTAGQAAALKATINVLKQGLPVLFFPEGEFGTAYGLVEALQGTGTFIVLASRRAAVVPCAFWEEGDILRGQIAPRLTITDSDDAAVRQQVMIAIGKMLPESMWGSLAGLIRETPD